MAEAADADKKKALKLGVAKLFKDNIVPRGSMGERPMPAPYKKMRDSRKCASYKMHGSQLTTNLIEHALLEGVTSEMLSWFFNNLDGVCLWEGKEVPFYWLWHPDDHVIALPIRDARNRVVGLTMREGMGRDPEHCIAGCMPLADDNDLTKGIRLDIQKDVMFLQHSWTDSPEGLVYNSFFQGPGSHESSLRWLQHNVEEVGMLQFFLPKLYAERETMVVQGRSAFDVFPPAKDLSLTSSPLREKSGDVIQWWEQEVSGKTRLAQPIHARNHYVSSGGEFKLYEVPDLTKATLMFDALTQKASQ